MINFLTPADPLKWRELSLPGNWYASPKVYNIATQILGCMNWALALSSFYWPIRVSPNPLINRLFTISTALFSQIINALILNSYYLSALKRHVVEQFQWRGYDSISAILHERNILSPQELNELLSREIHALTYQAFVNKHGYPLTILNADHRRMLEAKFTNELQDLFNQRPLCIDHLHIPDVYTLSPINISISSIHRACVKRQILDRLQNTPQFGYKDIPLQYREEGYILTFEELRPFLERDIQNLSYQAFIERHGTDVLNILGPKLLEQLHRKCRAELQAYYKGQGLFANPAVPFLIPSVIASDTIYRSVQTAKLIYRLKKDCDFGYRNIPNSHLYLLETIEVRDVIDKELQETSYSAFARRHGRLPPFINQGALLTKLEVEYGEFLDNACFSERLLKSFPLFPEHEIFAQQKVKQKIITLLKEKGYRFLPLHLRAKIKAKRVNKILKKELQTRTYVEWIERHGPEVLPLLNKKIYDDLCRLYEKEFTAYLENQPLSSSLGIYEHAPDEHCKITLLRSVRKKQIMAGLERGDLGYRDIPSDYQSLLFEEEINHLITRDLEHQSHVEFIEKHGPEVFPFLNPVNLTLAKGQFIHYVATQKAPLRQVLATKMHEKLQMSVADVKNHLDANEQILSLQSKTEEEQRLFLIHQLGLLVWIIDPSIKEVLLQIFQKIFLSDIEKDISHLCDPHYVRLVQFFSSSTQLHREIVRRIRAPQAASLSYSTLCQLYTSAVIEQWSKSDAACQQALREIYLKLSPAELALPAPDLDFLGITRTVLKETLKKYWQTVSTPETLASTGKELFLEVACENPQEWTPKILHDIQGRSILALARTYPELFTQGLLTLVSCLPGEATLFQRVEEEASHLPSWEAFVKENSRVLYETRFYRTPSPVIAFLALNKLAAIFEQIRTDCLSLPSNYLNPLFYLSEATRAYYNAMNGAMYVDEDLATRWLHQHAFHLLLGMPFERIERLLKNRRHLWWQFFELLQMHSKTLDPTLLQQAARWLENLSLQNPSPLTCTLAWSINYVAGDLFKKSGTVYTFENQDGTTDTIPLFVLRCLNQAYPGYFQRLVDKTFSEGRKKTIQTKYPQTAFLGLMEYYQTGGLTNFVKTHGENQEAVEDLWELGRSLLLPHISFLLDSCLSTHFGDKIPRCLDLRLDKKERDFRVQNFLHMRRRHPEQLETLWRLANRLQIPDIKTQVSLKLIGIYELAAVEGLMEFDEKNSISKFKKKYKYSIPAIKDLFQLAENLDLAELQRQLCEAFADVFEIEIEKTV